FRPCSGTSAILSVMSIFSFFFQAEDGIRDRNVTGVQTCALPILKQQKKRMKLLKMKKLHQKKMNGIGDRFSSSILDSNSYNFKIKIICMESISILVSYSF